MRIRTSPGPGSSSSGAGAAATGFTYTDARGKAMPSASTDSRRSSRAKTALHGIAAEARPVHRGRTTHVWQIDMTNDAGELTCVSRLTMAILLPRGDR